MAGSDVSRRASEARVGRERIRRWGATSWRIVGILLALAMGYSALVALSGLVVPLLLAAAVGALGVPVVDRLERRRIPRPAGALLLIVALIAILVVAIAMVVRGVLDERDEIRIVVAEGMRTIDDGVSDTKLIPDPDGLVDRVADQGGQLLPGAATWATTIFSTTVAFAIGMFLALFMLYYLLVDWAEVRNWLAGHLGVPHDLGAAIIDDAVDVVRRGFGAMTLTSLVVAGVIGVAMVLLGLPLAMAVTVVTFVTAYIPYLGAFVSAAFGFLVALGAGDVSDAVVLLVVILVAQNVIQTIVGQQAHQ